MFTLTAASKDTKTILKWTGIIIGFLILFFVLIRVVVIIKEALYPTPPAKPTVSFGKLPKPYFPQNVTNAKLEYSLDTVSGNLPTTPEQLKVFKVFKSTPDLLSLRNVSQKFANAGFDQNQTKISDSVYSWTNRSENFPKKIEVNIFSGNFTLTSDFASNSALLFPTNPPTEQTATEKAESFLQSIGYLSDQIDTSQTQAQILSLQGKNLVEATSLSNTQFVNVDFYQKNLNGYPIFYELPNRSNISLLIGSLNSNPEILRATFILQTPIQTSSTYPLKSAKQAFEELKNGNAYIASYYSTDKKVSIKNVYLSYYISSKEQKYITPIIIFEGDNGFFAYVNAVRDEWIDK